MRYRISCRLAPCSHSPLDAARGLPVAAADGNWYESYAPGSLRLTSRTSVHLGHDTAPIGTVDVLAAHKGWIYCDMTIEDPDEATLARLKPGTPVSLGAHLLVSDDDHHLRTRRVELAALEHVALGREGERGTFARAVITSVKADSSATRATSSGGGDWRSKLPVSHREFADLGDEYEGYVLTNRHGSIKWNGSEFVAVGGRRLAA